MWCERSAIRRKRGGVEAEEGKYTRVITQGRKKLAQNVFRGKALIYYLAFISRNTRKKGEERAVLPEDVYKKAAIITLQ